MYRVYRFIIYNNDFLKSYKKDSNSKQVKIASMINYQSIFISSAYTKEKKPFLRLFSKKHFK